MYGKPLLAILGCAALIVAGLALATVTPWLGTVVTVAGIVLLAAFLIAAFRVAWAGDQKRAWDPGSLRREDRDEQATKPR